MGTIDPNEGLAVFARTISSDLFGLVEHQPKPWAKPAMCFINVLEQAEREGGGGVPGWTFQSKTSEKFGGYLLATHHAVWRAPNGSLIDVTPLHENPLHHPHVQDGAILFLLDFQSPPVMAGGRPCSRPLRFFPLSDDEALGQHLRQLGEREEEECRRNYALAEAQVKG